MDAIIADLWEHGFVLGCPGEAWVGLTLAARGTSWGRGEAAVLTLEVDGSRRQELVLAAGDEPTEYLRLLGPLPAGPHVLRLRIDRALSAPSADTAVLSDIRTGCVSDGDAAAPVWRSAPILHYRNLDLPLDGISTDTPLLLFYRDAPPTEDRPSDGPADRSPTPAGCRTLEYHVVFSHEDGGTDLTGLLAKWGHTTDIEWIYRIVWDRASGIAREEFQGPGHRTMPFRGDRTWGTHPVLQVTGRHGMVTDRVHCPFRTALVPALAQPEDEPREGVLQRFPWVYRVSALEVVRQVTLEVAATPDTRLAADPRHYLFLQWKRQPGDVCALEAAVRVGDRWYTSAWGRPDLAFGGTDAESTAVKLPAGASEETIQAIGLRAAAPIATPVEVRLVRAFFLDDAYRPRQSLPARGTARVAGTEAWVTAWERGEPGR